MTAARLAVQGWTLRLREVLAGLSAARLRWCVVCGRVGLWGWQPLCAAMAITWVRADRAGCRSRQAVRASRQEWWWRRLVAPGRPGPAWPPTGRPWRSAGMAGPAGPRSVPQVRGPDTLTSGAVAVPELAARSQEQAGEATAEHLPACQRPDVATPGRGGGWR